MRFWDTSAVVPLVVEESRSSSCRRLARGKETMVVWVLTRTEVLSAAWRRARAGDLRQADVARVLDRIGALATRWTEVTAVDLVRERAERLLGAHALRAADALQLAAALVSVKEVPRGRELVVVDGALATAARAEGFTVLVPQA